MKQIWVATQFKVGENLNKLTLKKLGPFILVSWNTANIIMLAIIVTLYHNIQPMYCWDRIYKF